MIVDLGCGSGEFTARLATLVEGGRVIGMDADSSMIDQARRHEPDNLDFIQAQATELDAVVAHDSVDLVVSRAMLHWLPRGDYVRCFMAVHHVLRPGGWFHAESGGAGNVAKVLALLHDVATALGVEGSAPLPDAGEVHELLEEAGFLLTADSVRTVAQRRAFNRAELEAFLRTQAAVVPVRQRASDAAEDAIEAVVAAADRLRRADGTWDQTFVRLEILTQRRP